MQQAGGQGSEGRHPSSPRGAGGGNLPKFSLLGQQLTSYAQQNPAPSANMGFSLGVHPHQQPQNHQPHSQAFAQAQNMNGGGGGGGNERGYTNFLQNMANPAVGGGPSFSQNNNQNNNNPHFMNQLQPGQAIQNMQHNPEAIISALSLMQQKIGQLQAIYIAAGQAQVGNNSQAQQQQVVASNTINMISQLAAVANTIFSGPGPIPQQNPAVPNQQQQLTLGNNFPGPPNNQQQLNVNEIIQHLGESIPPQAYNFFQQQGAASSSLGQQGLPSMNSLSMGNNFAPMQAGGGGNNPLAGSLVGQSLVGNLGGVFGCDGGSGSSPNPGQNLRNKELGSVPNNQMGNGIARNTLGTSGGGREAAVMSSRPSHQSIAGGSLSQLDDDGGRRRSRGDEDDDGEGEKLDPSEYELIEMDAMEILAEHTHFCEICGKGFKRDANLRMHMRGHGDEYKTPAALARPDKAAHDQAAVKERRYSCPYAGCKRNKKHRKFAPLKTMLCVKNHYRRSHCPKMLSCQKCKSKKFSVVADLKTHEKHCGCDKWQCSCGTTFSRKDKLLGHIALFAGHTPAVPLGDVDNHRELDSIDLSSSNQNSLVPQQQSVNNSSGYNISGIGNGMIAGLSSGMGSGGNGSGMGHVMGPGGMHGRLADESNAGSETPPSSSYSPGGQGLLPQSSMLSGLFTSNFLQGSSGGNSSSDCLQ